MTGLTLKLREKRYRRRPEALNKAPMDYRRGSYIAAESAGCGVRAYVTKPEGIKVLLCFTCGLYHDV